MSEADEQRAVVEWCGWMRIPVFHIPNGWSRRPAEVAPLKGLDPLAACPYSGLLLLGGFCSQLIVV